MVSPDKISFGPEFTAPPRSVPALTGHAADLFVRHCNLKTHTSHQRLSLDSYFFFVFNHTRALWETSFTDNKMQDNLTLNERPSTNNNNKNNTDMMRPPPPRSNTGGPLPPPYSATGSSRAENVPPRGHPSHRPSRSQEEAMRARRIASGNTSRRHPSQELDIFADPIASSPKKTDPRRVRRNSESSIMEKSGKLLDPEEEKRRQERRRRERKHREGSKSKKPDRKLDLIDKLDVTSIYGTGCEYYESDKRRRLIQTVFHHDGPFDACNPHRNRQGSRRAPMQAFPKDSLNNVLGGGGPINKRPDHATFLGNNDDEAFKDYSKGGAGFNGYEPYNERPRPVRQDSAVVSATTRVEPIHGEETLGLGTSTFLEGAPASRTAMQRRGSEQNPVEAGGLSRKKSLAQKIRGINNTRRENGPSGRVTSPDSALGSPETPLYTPGGSRVETNPFFNEFSKGDDIKKESITIREPEKPERSGRPRAPSSPVRTFGERLERRVTSDGGPVSDQSTAKTGGSGFLSRVKSLKGPRKPRGDRPSPPQQLMDA